MALNQPINTETSGYSRSYRRLVARNPGYVIVQAALAVLRRYGQDAHIYLPGVGMMNGLQAGNYLDSAGTTQGTVDQPVGLVLDAAGGLGVDLVTAPTVAAVPIGGPAFTSYVVGPATVAGKTYSVAFTVSDYSGTGNVSLDGGTGQWVVNPSATGDSSLAGNGTKNFIIQCAASALLRVFSRSTNTCTFSNISVREVTGIAASQPTTSAKPILRRGAVNLLTYSGDFSNAAWAKSNGATAPSSNQIAITSTGNSGAAQILNSVAIGSTLTAAVSISGTPGAVVRLMIEEQNGAYPSNTLAITLTATPTIYAVSRTTTSFTSLAIIIRESGAATTVTCGGAALFQGTLTVAQIQALGGIPLTTTAPASTALGPYFWQFDGSNDSLALGSVPFGLTDDFAIVAGFSSGAPSAWSSIFSCSGAGTTPRIQLLVDSANGFLKCYFRDNAGVNTSLNGATDLRNKSIVVSLRKTGSTVTLSVNGILIATGSVSALGAATFTVSALGMLAGGTDYYVGGLNNTSLIKGTLTDPDLLLLEKFVGQMSGVSI